MKNVSVNSEIYKIILIVIIYIAISYEASGGEKVKGIKKELRREDGKIEKREVV